MAQYLPVLLVSVSAITPSAPDDSVLDTQAAGQVDYLSHNWQEEDVARSWRNMTRRKDSIQNGARLENASWRTWWKQRNKLPTVSPETLNWLKDSDVTWLYGPLHTANDWPAPQRNTPSPSHQDDRDIPSSSDSVSHQPSRSSSPWALKSILKHRSISELLAASFPNMDTDEGDTYVVPRSASALSTRTATLSTPTSQDDESLSRKRPRLAHTRSDNTVTQRNPFRRDSPPLPLIPEGGSSTVDATPAPLLSSLALSSSPISSDSLSVDSANPAQQKRHISFNTFVEQCIAIEKPKKLREGWFDDIDEDVESRWDEDDGYREDDEDSNEEYDSDEDALVMRAGNSASRLRHHPVNGRGPSSYSSMDSEREHFTIAPIAPTRLKTSESPPPTTGPNGFGLWDEEEVEEDEQFLAHGSPPVSDHSDTVPLVFAPPQGSVYAERLHVNGGGGSGSRGFSGISSHHHYHHPHHNYQQQHHHPSSSSSPSGPFEEANAYGERRREDIELEPEPEDSDFDVRGVTDEVVYSPYHPKDEQTLSEVQSIDSKGGSSEEGTVVAQPATHVVLTFPQSASSSSLASGGDSVPASAINAATTTTTTLSSSPSSVPIPVPVSRHAHSSSPAPSATSNSTTASTPSSPFLDAAPRGRSTSPNTSISPNGGDRERERDAGRGRCVSRKASSDRDFSRDERERDPPRGRSRSRSIGADGGGGGGSVSPRSGLSRRSSVDSGMGMGLGYSGSGYGYGLVRERERREPSSSLSPDEGSGTIARRSRVSRGAGSGAGSITRVDSGSISGGEGWSSSPSTSVSPPPPERERGRAPPRTDSASTSMSTSGAVSRPIDIPGPQGGNPTPAIPSPNAASPTLPPPPPPPAVVIDVPPQRPTINVQHVSSPSISTTTPTATTPSVNGSVSSSTTTSPTPTATSAPVSAVPRGGGSSNGGGEDSSSIMGRAVSSAKGYFGSLWNSTNNGTAAAAQAAGDY